MSLDELKERIKDEVVLREGDLFEWQWQQLGLVTEAEAAGVPAGDFLKIVNDVSRAINPYFGRISDLKINVADQARQARKKLTAAQVDRIVAEATRLQLRPAFVKEQWIPAILSTLPEPPPETDRPAAVVPPATAAPNPIPAPTPAPAPGVPPVVPAQLAAPARPRPRPADIDRDVVMQKVHQLLDEYKADKHIPASVLRPLFVATTFDQTVLADAVLAYLSANFYAAEVPVRGEQLKDKLLSSNWRHLSWWVSAPVGAVVSPTLPQTARPTPRRASDSSVIGMAVVAVGLLVGTVWWVTGKTADAPAPKAAVSPPKPVDTVMTPPKKKLHRRGRAGQH